MNTRGYFLIFFFTFSDIWDLSASQNESMTQTHITAAEEYGTAWERQVTLTASSSHESITHTTALIRTSVTTSESQNAPPPTSAPCSQVHVGSFLGGMLLAFIITLAVCLGYRVICSRQRGRGQGRYRALEQHDAII